MESAERQFYTVAEAARLLNVSPVTIWRWIEAQKLRAYRVGPRNIRIRKEDLDDMIKPAREKEPAIDDREVIRFEPVPEEELARRKKLVDQILARRKGRIIAPLTGVDLIRMAREKRTDADEG